MLPISIFTKDYYEKKRENLKLIIQEPKENKYKKGKIYKLINPDFPGKVYYGSTIKPLGYRLTNHKQKSTCSSRELINGNEKIILIQNKPCDNKKELEKRERWYIEHFDCINKKIPGRTKKEYIQNNKEKYNLRHKKYREKNKEKINLYAKIYRENNKEKMKLKQREKIECKICKKIYSRRYMFIHKKKCGSK